MEIFNTFFNVFTKSSIVIVKNGIRHQSPVYSTFFHFVKQPDLCS